MFLPINCTICLTNSIYHDFKGYGTIFLNVSILSFFVYNICCSCFEAYSFCNTDAVEDEKHFLFECALYNNLRTTYSADIFIHDHSGTLDDKLVYAMTNHPRMITNFLLHAYLLRRKYMYKWNNNVNHT